MFFANNFFCYFTHKIYQNNIKLFFLYFSSENSPVRDSFTYKAQLDHIADVTADSNEPQLFSSSIPKVELNKNYIISYRENNLNPQRPIKTILKYSRSNDFNIQKQPLITSTVYSHNNNNCRNNENSLLEQLV